ncbi:MAG: dockerin type I domain-containing protein, partial [bacterium]|nr:dockerin type I domain-containing protein [bacterium]
AFAETEIRLNPSNIPGQIDGIARIEAQLRDVLTGAGVAGKPLRFFVDNALVATVSTNASGVAVHNYRVPSTATAGQRYPVRVVWEGDPTADAAVAEGTITVERIRTRTTVPSRTTGRWGQSIDLSATVTREDDGRALQGVQVRFFVGGTEVGTATTNSAGRAFVSFRVSFLGEASMEARAVQDARHEASAGTGAVQGTYPILRGTIQLQDYLGPRDLPAVLDIFDRQDPNKWKRIPIPRLDNKGGFEIEAPIFGDVRASVKVSHWLRQNLFLRVQDITTAVWDLINGDVDEDNEISLLDFGYLVAAFGTTPNDNGWFANADLDGDEEVNLLDFGILVRNF